MKKSLLVIFLLICVMGCGKSTKKTLKCSWQDQDEESLFQVHVSVSANLESDTVTGLQKVSKFTFSDDEMARTTYDAYQTLSELEDVQLSLDGSVITMKETESYQEPVSKQQFMEEWTFQGYTCEE